MAAFAAFTPTAAADDAAVTIDDNVFVPSSVTIEVGDTVTWTWSGSNNHSTSSDAGQAESWDSGIRSSGTFAHTFDDAGTFTYHCTVHSSMHGTVVVQGSTTISVADATARETDGRLRFEVSLSSPSTEDVSVGYATSDGSAVSDADYVSTSGILTIPAGETLAKIKVPVRPDLEPEGDEDLTMVLSDPVGADIADGIATGTIADDPCTVRGDGGPNTLTGTTGPDVVCGGGGDDVIVGLGGVDRLVGGAGDDDVSGGGGGDSLIGGRGADTLSGGAGDDTLDGRDGTEGNDELNGGRGTDTCKADSGDARLGCE